MIKPNMNIKHSLYVNLDNNLMNPYFEADFEYVDYSPGLKIDIYEEAIL